LSAGDWRLAQQIRGEILEWRGERNRARGARPELQRLGPSVPGYLQACDGLMRLDQAVVAGDGSLATGGL